MAVRSKRKIQKNILSMIREHGNYRRFVRVVIPVALVLMLTAYWAMHMNAISMSSTELVCTIEEHTHTTGCYAWVSADGSVLGESGSGTVVTADTENTETTGGTESIDGTESIEATESIEGTESIEATESTEDTESGQETESIEDTESTESIESIENTENTEEIEDSEEAETTQYVLPTDPKVGDTITVYGVEYAYTLTCNKEEHTHTASCYLDVSDTDETETIEDSGTAVAYSYGDDSEEEQSGESTEDEGAYAIMTADLDDDSGDSSSSVSEESEGSDSVNTTESGSTETSSSSGSVTYTVTSDTVTYDDSTGDFYVKLKMAFVFAEKASGTGYEYVDTNYDHDIVSDEDYKIAYRVALPDGVIVPSSLLEGSAYNGYLETDNSTVVFKYYFVSDIDSEGNTIYYVYIVFLNKDDLAASGYGTDSTLEGYIEYWGYLSSDSYVADGDYIAIKDRYTEDLVIKVEGSKVTYSGNSTVTEDISVVKSGSYDSSSNTVTYTVIVYTQKGTGDTIELTDVFTDSGFADILSNVGELTSIQYATTTVSYTSWAGEDYGVTAAEAANTDIEKGDSSTGTAPYYYTDDDGTIHIVLNKLSAYADGYNSSGSNTSNAYVITYTYKVDPDYQTTYSSTNSVTASTDYGTEDYTGTITDTDTETVYVKGTSFISKTGSYDSSTGKITWTITVGDGTKDLNGYALSDSMITGLIMSDISIKDGDGNEVDAGNITSCYRTSETDSSGNVTYAYYSDSELTTSIEYTDLENHAIVYVLDANSTDSSGNHTVSTILFNSGKQYTITYTTSVDSVWKSQTVTNVATLTYEGSDADKEGDSYSASQSMYVIGTGTNAFSKEYTGVAESEDSEGNTILTLSWTSTFTVPSTGIPKGTVFTDYVSDSSNSTSHYITAEQASAIVTALNTAWGSGNISIEFCTSNNYWSTSSTDWVSADSLDELSSTLYYQFRYTLLNDIDSQKGTISYTYATTATTAGYDLNTYYNTLTDGSNSKSANHSWYAKVAKYGVDTSGNLKSGASEISTSIDDKGNLTVSWVVRVLVDSDGTVYNVTDTLPTNVTLSSLQVSKYGNYSYNDISTEGIDAGDVSTEISGIGTFLATSSTESGVQTITLKVSGIETDVNMIYLKYTCTYAAGTDAAGTSTALTNKVSVTTGEETTEYGDASQTTTVTIPSTTYETTVLTKESAFDDANNVLTYTVDINPTGKTYTDSDGEAYADLTVTDVLTYYSFPGQGMVRTATLITSSLKLINADTGEELDESEYSWTYSEETTTYDWGYTAEYITQTLTLTVPNGIHLSLEYEYSFSIVHNGEWDENTTKATNTATLSAESESIYTTPGLYDTSTLSDVQTYGEASAGTVGYTIYKVDEDNFSVKLSGATYTLYTYDKGTKNFIAVGDYTTGTGGSVTISATPEYDNTGELVSYSVKVPNDKPVSVPVDTICFFVETAAPENYKLDDTKYYFFYGSSISQSASACTGYTSNASDAKNMVLSSSIYITNEHSSDYYAAKTSISVIKTWFDANGDEYEKSDGSITFNLYRILKLNDGTITNSSLETGSSSGSSSSSGSTSSDGSIYLTWSLAYNGYNDVYVTYENGKTKVSDNTATLTVTYSGNNQYWYTPLQLMLVTDSGYTELATAGGSGTWSYNIIDTSVVESVDYVNNTYVFTLKNITSSMEILCYASYVYSYNVSSVVLDATVTSGTDTSSSSSSSGSSSDDSSTSSTSSTSGTVYRLNFSDLYEESDFKGEDGNYGDLKINGYYGWTDAVKETLSGAYDDNSGFFHIQGTGNSATDGAANLSVSHGTASYDIDGDGEVDEDEADMEVCLKMENGYGTTISFTANEGGYLTMVFNSDGSGNSVKLTKNGDTTVVLSPSKSLYVIYEWLDAGSYTITYNQSCYLFYIAFDEGATYVEDNTDTSIHNFNNGTDSTYYSISGSLSYYYGMVSYDDVIASQCLKMSSSASITFTSEEAGTIYLIMTNPKGASKVGVTLDGEEVYATATTTADSKGYRIYTVMQRVDAGTHTITRINGTEVMLYYIAYMADDYDGKTWKENSQTAALTGLTEEEQESYNTYKELVKTVTISASTDWSWYSSTLPSEYVDTDTGVVLGEYYYFVVETKINGEALDSSNYTTTYLNDDGISYGSIGISNKIEETSTENTSVTLIKNWVYGDGAALSIGDTNVSTTATYGVSDATISYGLYAVMTLTGTTNLTAGDSINRTFTSATSDTFYTVTGSTSPNGTTDPTTKEKYGDVIYGDTSTDKGLKLEKSKGTVTFDAPATNGTLTLVFSTYNKDDSSTWTAMYGPNFAITGPEGKYIYTYKYDQETNSGTLTVTDSSGNTVSDPYSAVCKSYSTTDNAAVFTFTLPQAGEYTVGKGSTECYLHYIDYAYQYCNLVDGVLIQSGTLSVDDIITDSTNGETTWAKIISGLPANIYSEDGDNTVIGYYSYYVIETGVTLTVDGKTYVLEYDSSKPAYYVSYTVDDIEYKYIVRPSISMVVDGSEATTEDPITGGSITITNVLSRSTTETGSILPATGGLVGRRAFYAIVATLMGACAAALLTHLHLESVRRRKRRRR